MRIVFVAYHGSVHTHRWVAFFAGRGHDVHVVTCGGGGPGGSAVSGYQVHDLGPPPLGKLGYLAKVPAARRVVRRLHPDVVHAHYATSYGALAVATGFHPLIVTAHGDDVLIAPQNPMLRILVAAVLRRADLVTVPGEHMAAAVHRLVGRRPTPVSVFQYGVDAARLASLATGRDGAPAGGRPLRIVSVRPLTPLYGVDHLVRALPALRARGVDFRCQIIGDGPEAGPLRQLAEESGVGDRVTFVGAVPPWQVEAAMAAADVYVSLSRSDGASIALLEAMALGAVPVLSDIPANRAWAADGAAVLVDVTPAGVAAGIERAARLDRHEAARRNRDTVLARADLATNLGRFEDVMHSLRGSL